MALALPPQVAKIGILTPEEKAKMQNWIIQKWGNGNPQGSPICGRCKNPSMTWIIGEYVFTPLLFTTNGSINLGGVAFPVVPVMCSNCGETHFVNAIVAGLVTPKTDQPAGTQTGGIGG